MLSRIADSLFWLSRYMERSEGMLRSLHTTYVLSLDTGREANSSWKALLEIFSGLEEEKQLELQNAPNEIVRYLVSDLKNSNSLKMIVNKSRENARGMQDHITKEVWEQVNQLYHLINGSEIELELSGTNQIQTIELLQKNCLLYTGIVDTTMPRSMSWGFMNLGKYIERAILTIELLDKNYESIAYDLNEEKDILFWRGLLFSLSGYEFHLKTYRSSETNANVGHQVLFNHQFPHSVLYCVKRIKTYLDTMVKENNPEDQHGIIKQFGRISSSVEFTDFVLIKESGMQAYLIQLKNNLRNFTKTLSQDYFSYS